MTEREGVIRFQADHRDTALSGGFDDLIAKISAWRQVLRAAGWVGQDPRRYGGYGYGNLSVRVPEPDGGFLITGSQTSGLERVTAQHFSWVLRWSTENNQVESRGSTLPSSESLSHAALYDASPEIRAVFHVHAPRIFRLRRPATAERIEAGTPEMARDIGRVWASLPPEGFGGASRGVLVMGGHSDGVLAFGESIDAAGRSLVRAGIEASRQFSSASDAS